jgi:hypothetical protein
MATRTNKKRVVQGMEQTPNKRARTDRYPVRPTEPPVKYGTGKGPNPPFKQPAKKAKEGEEVEEGEVDGKNIKMPRGNFNTYRTLMNHPNYKKLPLAVRNILEGCVKTEEGDDKVQLAWTCKDRLINQLLRTAFKAAVREDTENAHLLTEQLEAFTAREAMRLQKRSKKAQEKEKEKEEEKEPPTITHPSSPPTQVKCADEDDDDEKEEGECNHEILYQDVLFVPKTKNPEDEQHPLTSSPVHTNPISGTPTENKGLSSSKPSTLPRLTTSKKTSSPLSFSTTIPSS